MIILHAITREGPLGERARLKWSGDTPHPKENRENVAQGGEPFVDDMSAELLWVSSSNSGDYHDNMNSVSTCCTSQCDRFANEIVTVLLENVRAMGQVQTVPYVQKEISRQDHDSLL